MTLFGKSKIPLNEVKQLKTQGLTDSQIIDELKGQGYPLSQINDALSQAGLAGQEQGGYEAPAEEFPAPPQATSEEFSAAAAAPSAIPEELHGRIEEIAENIIDEKWDLLVGEIKKVIEWKEKVEDEVSGLKNDVGKLKEDFKELHMGVLGKLETYDEKMTEVGTELKAVGKVFKEVIPEFVENVKELRSITKGVKKKQ
jgi:DNA-binding transcriptional MerR regulator